MKQAKIGLFKDRNKNIKDSKKPLKKEAFQIT